MTEFEMMKKMVKRFSNEIDWEIEGNTISINSDGVTGEWTSFIFDEEGKAIEIR